MNRGMHWKTLSYSPEVDARTDDFYSTSAVCRAPRISKSLVVMYVSLAKVAGVDCTVADGFDDAELVHACTVRRRYA